MSSSVVLDTSVEREGRQLCEDEHAELVKRRMMIIDVEDLTAVIPVPSHAPLWLYWAHRFASWSEDFKEVGPVWTDGIHPVLAISTLAEEMGREGQRYLCQGVVLICDKYNGPTWIRTETPGVRSVRDTSDLTFRWYMSLHTIKPARGANAAIAPRNLTEGADYRELTADERGDSPPWDEA